jgi:phosphohistidine swiveling domain-containing protein
MESIARDIRRGLPWVAWPLIFASALRLGLEPAYWSRSYFVWLLLIPAYVATQRLILRWSRPLGIRLSLWLNFATISVGYEMIGVALRSTTAWRADDLVYAIDCAIFHGDPQRFLARIQAPWLSFPGAAPVGVLQGIPGSPGVATGLIQHVRSQNDFATLKTGSILVARTTNPAWTSLFFRAAGIVTGSGGPLSHGAVTAREIGIPAVMAIPDVFKTLPDGKSVTINGSEGRVQIH